MHPKLESTYELENEGTLNLLYIAFVSLQHNIRISGFYQSNVAYNILKPTLSINILIAIRFIAGIYKGMKKKKIFKILKET